MASVNKAFGQTEKNQRVLFQILDTGGTPSIVNVSPAGAAEDISVADTATGRATVTIKNMKGPKGVANIQATARTTSVWPSVVSVSYSGDTLSFEVSTENDASSLTDTTTDVVVEAF